jgi:hypothetical protein
VVVVMAVVMVMVMIVVVGSVFVERVQPAIAAGY